MRFQFIACKIMQREAYLCAARSKNTIDLVLMEKKLHDVPDKLRAKVQEALDRTCDVQGRRYDASLLGYGLCSNGIVGLSAKIPVVAVTAHVMKGDEERFIKAGCIGYIPKPIDVHQFKSTVAGYLEK